MEIKTPRLILITWYSISTVHHVHPNIGYVRLRYQVWREGSWDYGGTTTFSLLRKHIQLNWVEPAPTSLRKKKKIEHCVRGYMKRFLEIPQSFFIYKVACFKIWWMEMSPLKFLYLYRNKCMFTCVRVCVIKGHHKVNFFTNRLIFYIYGDLII